MMTLKTNKMTNKNEVVEFMLSYLTELRFMSVRCEWPEMNYYLSMALEEAKSQSKLNVQNQEESLVKQNPEVKQNPDSG